jgi:hypothetical protein
VDRPKSANASRREIRNDLEQKADGFLGHVNSGGKVYHYTG